MRRDKKCITHLASPVRLLLFCTRLLGRIIARSHEDHGKPSADLWHGMEPRSLADLKPHDEEIKANPTYEKEFQVAQKDFHALYESVFEIWPIAEDDLRKFYGQIVTNAFNICDYAPQVNEICFVFCLSLEI